MQLKLNNLHVYNYIKITSVDTGGVDSGHTFAPMSVEWPLNLKNDFYNFYHLNLHKK